MINTLFTGQHLIHLTETDSTNAFAKSYLSNSSPIDGTVIMADVQTAGRGQHGATWYSEPGKNLTLSIIYHTHFLPAKAQFYLNMAVSLAIYDTVNQWLPENNSHIKWPNDILLSGKKVCGILIENTLRGENLLYSIIGIGWNINQARFPEELPMATSMALVGERNFDLQALLADLLQHLEARFLQLKQGSKSSLRTAYLEALYGKDIPLSMKDDTGTFTGIIKGVDDTGRLLVEKHENVVSYAFKEIVLL